MRPCPGCLRAREEDKLIKMGGRPLLVLSTQTYFSISNVNHVYLKPFIYER